MTSFLEKVTAQILQRHTNIGRLVIVTPGKRVSAFILKHIQEQIDGPSFLPKFYNIQDFASEVSGLQCIKDWQLIFNFYDVYIKIHPDQPRDLLKFTTWAQVVLSDFTEIDKSMVEASQVFSYFKAFKDMKKWSVEDPEEESIFQNDDIWENLEKYYSQLKSHLMNEGTAYEGLAYRVASEKATEYLLKNMDNHFVFLGFNALSKAEETLFKTFLDMGRVDIFWDIDQYFMEDIDQEAGLFLRKYKTQWKYYQTHPFDWVAEEYSKPKNISITRISGDVGQAHYVSNILNQDSDRNTVIIIGKNSLIEPLFSAISGEINITMGYPLTQSIWMSFFKDYLSLYAEEEDSWYYVDIMRIISHPLYKMLFGDAKDLKKMIYNRNQTRWSNTTISKHLRNTSSGRVCLFRTKNDLTLKQLLDLCQSIILLYQEQQPEEHPIHHECSKYFYGIFVYLKQIVSQYDYIRDVKTLCHIFVNIASSERVSLEGQTTEGHQLMGMLESRSLDFNRVIITSVNEGVFPKGDHTKSFLTYDLRRELGMPTQQEQDAIYSYHFYRLLQRSKEVFLLYDSSESSLGGGDKSRFLLQIETEHPSTHRITHHTANAVQSDNRSDLKQVKKDKAYLKQITLHAKKGFSPSSLTSYIYNPITYYTRYILGLKEVNNVEEALADNTFGTVMHNTLEVLYKPFEEEYLRVHDIRKMRDILPKTLQVQFDQYASFSDSGVSHTRGKNYIIYNVILEYLFRFLTKEDEMLKSGHTIKILKIEAMVDHISLATTDKFPINIKGKIDRIDVIDDKIIRIVDYKSGLVNNGDLTLGENDMTVILQDKKYSKSFQVLMYSLMIHKSGLFDLTNSQAGIISFKNLKEGFIKFTHSSSGKQTSIITPEILEEFQGALITLIHDIADMGIPILEKEIKSHKINSLF